MVKKSLCGLTAHEIFDLISTSGFTMAHAISVSNDIYKKNIRDISHFENIPRKLREQLTATSVCAIYSPVSSEVSIDNSVKYLFRNEEGQEFETVYIPDGKRNTVCVSTQAGCRMGCSFCVTAKYGYQGNLNSGDIINQIIGIPQSDKVTHIVFMGMGEPMDNLDNVLKACDIITAEWGLAVSSRNVTVSTVGILPGVEQFLRRSECNLTLSLFSPFNEQRENNIPVETRFPAIRTIEVMKNFPLKKKRRLSLAYVMINGLNDTERHLEKLKSIVKGSAIRINLLPYHGTANELYSSSSIEQMHHFKHELVVSGISASIRKSRGVDISAACGLLASGLKSK
jgi:23S rRNA (adenine2503-C2)-methyltransferase